MTRIATPTPVPMTRVSLLDGWHQTDDGRKPPELLGCGPVARAVHGCATTVLFLVPLVVVASSGCVIPPSLSVDDPNQDAGVNAAPLIRSVSTDQMTELTEPGPVSIVRGANAGALFVTVYDTDVSDRLTVLAFVDYSLDDPMPARSACLAPPTGTVTRSCSADLAAVCQVADVGRTPPDYPLMTVKVFDRDVLTSGEPLFQAMPPGGLSSGVTYRIQCSDGGE